MSSAVVQLVVVVGGMGQSVLLCTVGKGARGLLAGTAGFVGAASMIPLLSGFLTPLLVRFMPELPWSWGIGLYLGFLVFVGAYALAPWVRRACDGPRQSRRKEAL